MLCGSSAGQGGAGGGTGERRRRRGGGFCIARHSPHHWEKSVLGGTSFSACLCRRFCTMGGTGAVLITPGANILPRSLRAPSWFWLADATPLCPRERSWRLRQTARRRRLAPRGHSISHHPSHTGAGCAAASWHARPAAWHLRYASGDARTCSAAAAGCFAAYSCVTSFPPAY